MLDESLDYQLEDGSFYIATPELLNELIAEDYPQIRLGPSVSQVLTALTNGFLEDIVKNSYIISRQRRNFEVQSEDILIYLRMKYSGTGIQEFCELQSGRKDMKNSNNLYTIESNTSFNNNGLSSLKYFNIERLKRSLDMRKRMHDYICID